MTKLKTLSVNIPFSGFYESAHSSEIEREIENYFDKEGTGEGYKLVPHDFYYTFKHMGEIEKEYAELYCQMFCDYFTEETKLELPFTFEEMTSPREYNFQTDRLFCLIPLKNLRAVYKQIDKEVLAETIRQRFTSYDGFISSYSNNLKDWTSKPLSKWDHNELGTLIMAAMKQHNPKSNHCEFDIMEPALCNGMISDIVYPYVAQWEKENPYLADVGLKLKQYFDLPDDEFEALTEEEKDTLREKYDTAHYRCENTMELPL